MNRTIKFRAWDEGNKKMHTNVFFLKTGDNGNDWIVFSSDQQRHKTEDNKIIFDNPYFSRQIKLMQWTGLTDKNDKPIYEGDIFKWKKFIGHVIFKDGCFVFDTNDNYSMTMRDHLSTDFEVIGNIYSNPELVNNE